MVMLRQPWLFQWRHIEAASDLDRLELVLATIPDEGLVSKLERMRGRGRDDYPIRPMWNALLAGIVFQHPTAAGLLRELSRNAQLRELCGFDPSLGDKAVASDSAFSRFLSRVIDERRAIETMFHRLVDELAAQLPDFGRTLAVDSKALPSYAKRQSRRVEEGRKESEQSSDQRPPHGDRRSDWDADMGVKTYRGVRPDGSRWEKVVKWFGFKLHLLVDRGEVFCTCPVTDERRSMFFDGFEKDRSTLKYRCPAAAYGLTCQGRAECESLAPKGVGPYGRSIRIHLDYDPRIFVPIARHSEKWKKAYNRRSAVERVNSRIDNVLGFEKHTIRGIDKMTTRLSLALVVMLSMALGRIRLNQEKLLRSFVRPVGANTA